MTTSILQEIFDIDIHLEHVVKAVNRYLGIRLRDFGCKLHMYYKKFGSNDRLRRSKAYSGVSHENWESICDWFQSDDFKKLSAKNSANRQHQEVNHCAGYASFARFQHKNCDPGTRKPLGRIELYHQTHFSEKGVVRLHLFLQRIMLWMKTLILQLMRVQYVIRFWVRGKGILAAWVIV